MLFVARVAKYAVNLSASLKFISLVPTAAPKVTLTFATSYSITLQWETVPSEHRNGDVTGYSIKYGEMESFNNQSKTVMNITGTSVTEATIFNLILSTNYSIQIAAVNNVGVGVFSNATIIKTAEQSEFVKIISGKRQTLRNHIATFSL